ncbi:leader peptidase (prepilin peptidase) / N-methyltransferase [Burkholderiaceae bacterium]|nr:leader peptidase (prepilin peptidase) / N-methyltransferase [Burkholderiaceae bacterium]
MTPEAASYLLSPPALAFLGLCIGSFLNVVIHRIPLMLERGWKLDSAEMLGVTIEPPAEISLAKPRSRCPSCGHAIAWYENIPVLSYLRLGGKCSACKTRISARYPLVEVLTGLLFAATAWRFGAQPTTLLWCGFVAALVALAGIDWDTTLLPDNLTLPLLWAGLVSAALGWTVPLGTALWGAVAGYLSLWSVYWIFKKATGKEGMGYGDFKLLAALGAWLGVQMVLPIVLAASVLGAVVGIAMKMGGGLREGRYVPFGPFLAGAGIVVMLAGPARVLGWLGWA